MVVKTYNEPFTKYERSAVVNAEKRDKNEWDKRARWCGG